MDQDPGLSEQYRMASPWPLLVALGIPISEIGILFDLFPVAVGGLLLFSGSVAGMLHEAGYVATPWRALGVLAVILVGVGAALAFTDVRLVTRGYAIIAAGTILLLSGVAGELFSRDDLAPV